MPAHPQLERFPVVIEVPVAWGEMDSYAHVNNIVYFRWFESARIAYFDTIGFRNPDEHDGVGPILASTQAVFRKPLAYPDTVLVGARVSDVGRDRFTMEYRLVSRTVDAIAAEGSGVIVAYSYRENRKAEVPTVIAERIRALEQR